MTPWRRARGPDNLPASTIKRRSERYLLNTRLIATVREDQRETRMQTHALDISEYGIGTLFHEGWDVGDRLDLEVMLPVDSVHLELRGIVRHHTATRCGLEFIDVSPEQREVLREACKVLAGRKSIPGTDLG